MKIMNSNYQSLEYKNRLEMNRDNVLEEKIGHYHLYKDYYKVNEMDKG